MSVETENKFSNEEINLRQVLAGFISRWHYFAFSLAFFLAFGFLYMRFSLPVYQAETSILIKDTKLAAKGNIEDVLNGDVFNTSRNLSTEIGILQSRSVVLKAAMQLKIEISYFGHNTFSRTPLFRTSPFVVEYTALHSDFYNIPFLVKLKEDGSFQLQVERDSKAVSNYNFDAIHNFNEIISSPYFSLRILKNDSSLANKDYNSFEFIIHSKNSLIARIKNNLQVSPINKDASIISVTFRDNIKQRARIFLNALSTEYINRDISDKASVATLTLKFIDEQLADITKELGSIESDLQQYKEHNKTVNLSEESKNYLERLNTIDIERVKAEIELRSLDFLYDYVFANKEIEKLSPSTIGTPDPILVQLITQLQTLQSKRKNLQFGARENSPALRTIDAQIAETKSLLIENINNIRGRTTVNLQSINKELKEFEQSIKRIPALERQLIGIQRQFDVNQNIFLYLLQKKAETSIARATVVSDNKVLDDASVNEVPVKPSWRLVLMVCFLLGTILPAIYMLLLDFVQNKITSRDEIEKLTKIPVIGIVGHMREAGERLVVHSKPKSSISEAFRSIRTNLVFFGMNEKNNVILITSSVGGEGKSFTAINLASVLALQNNKVIIVALDLRKSQLALDFGVENKTGVSTYLIGQSLLDAIIHHTEVPNLDFIASGPVPPNPAELISKEECATLINSLKERYDYVIVDTPPIGIVADALLLMKYSDLNVFILRQNYSRKENLKQINEYHRSGIIKHVSILFNDAGKTHTYGYGYGYYDDEQKRKKFLNRLFSRA